MGAAEPLHRLRLLSPKTVQLMSADATGDLINPVGMPGVGFGLGFAVVRDLGASGALGSAGTFSWGGILGTTFWIDPKERLIGVMMVQLFPNSDEMGEMFQTLAYQAITR